MLIPRYYTAAQQLICISEYWNIKTGSSKNSFTLKYNIKKLVYFECFTIAGDAFEREKQVKAGSRKKKMDLIISVNPEWKDLIELLKEYKGEELIRMKKYLR